MIEPIRKTEEEWKRLLTKEQYAVMRERGTERPFTCELKEYKGAGVYRCAACALPLFRSGGKFESGTGWPSFWQPIVASHIENVGDGTLGMMRTELRCARCNGHLGHVFEGEGYDTPTDLRYCINSVCLVHTPRTPA